MCVKKASCFVSCFKREIRCRWYIRPFSKLWLGKGKHSMLVKLMLYVDSEFKTACMYLESLWSRICTSFSKSPITHLGISQLGNTLYVKNTYKIQHVTWRLLRSMGSTWWMKPLPYIVQGKQLNIVTECGL